MRRSTGLTFACILGLAASTTGAKSAASGYAGLSLPISTNVVRVADPEPRVQDGRPEESKVRPKRVSPEAQRKRAALQKRLLLQQDDIRQQEALRAEQRQRLQQQQQESLRDQRHIQRAQRIQLDQSIRRLQQPHLTAQPPRIAPTERPLIEKQHSTCGVPNTPLCR